MITEIETIRKETLAAAAQRIDALAVPYDLPMSVTHEIWQRIISECITAVKGEG